MGNASSELGPGAGPDEVKFMQAVYEGNADAAAACLKAKPSVINTHTKEGMNPWHFAAQSGNVKLMWALLAATKAGERRPLPGQPPLVSHRNKKGRTPLMLACEQGHVEAMQFLLSCGVDVQYPDTEGNTALHYAALKGQSKVLEILLAAEDQSNNNPDSKFVNLRNKHDLMPLHFAAWGGSADAARVLLQYGARLVAASKGDSLSVITCNGGSSPMHLAALKGSEAVIKTLLDAYIQIITMDSERRRSVTCPDPRAVEDDYHCNPYQVAMNIKRDAIALILDPDRPLDIAPRNDPAAGQRAAITKTHSSVARADSAPADAIDPAVVLRNQKAAAEAAALAAGLPPPRFVGPITNHIMEDPVIASNGETYERSAIEMWFELGNTEYPGGDVKITSQVLTPNTELKAEIEAWKAEQKK